MTEKSRLKTLFHNANRVSQEAWEKFPFDAEATNIEDRIWGEQVIRAGFKIYEPTASVFHWHGIHHNLNLDRARKIVGILESLPGLRAGPGKGWRGVPISVHDCRDSSSKGLFPGTELHHAFGEDASGFEGIKIYKRGSCIPR